MYSKTMWNKQRYCWQLPNQLWIHNFRRSNWNYHARKISVSLRGPMTWKVMPRNAWNDIVTWQAGQLNNSTKCQLHAMNTIISKKNNGNPLENVQKYALKLFWHVHTWHVLDDPLFYGQWKNLQDTITKWTQACGKQLSRLISYFHQTCDYKQNCFVGNTAKQCRLGLFQHSDSAGDLEDPKSTSGGTLCFFGSHTFFQMVGCVRNKLQFRAVQQNQKSILWTQE